MEADLRVLRALNVFRWSFSQQMAESVLSERSLIKPGQAHEVLDSLCARGLLRHVAGDFFLEGDVRQDIDARCDDTLRQQGRRHLAAGAAIAPTWNAPDPLAPSISAPDCPAEAYYHFHEAWRLCRRSGDKQGETIARRALREAMRFGRVGGWRAAKAFVKLKDTGMCMAAYEFVEEFMDGWYRHPANNGTVPNHPFHLAIAARALQYTYPSSATISRFWKSDDKNSTIRDLFQRALAACGEFAGEETYNRLHVLSEYAEYLHGQMRTHAKAAAVGKEFDWASAEIRSLRASWRSCPGAIHGAWFEAIGDREPEHASAAATYEEGATFCPSWYSLLVKGAGAMSLAGTGGPMLDHLRRLADEDQRQAKLLLRAAEQGWKQDLPKRKKLIPQAFCWGSVLERWEAGFTVLLDAWDGHERLQEELNRLLRQVEHFLRRVDRGRY
jgi:hypothetical protein